MLRRFIWLVAIGSGTVASGTTLGANGTTCPVASLATYLSLGVGGCTVNGLLYTNFTLLSAFSNGATPTPTAADILLAPSAGGDSSLSFAYPVLTNNYVAFSIQYDWDPVPATGDTGLSLDVSGDVDVFQTLCPGGRFANVAGGCFGRPGDPSPVNLEVFNQHQGLTKLTDSATFTPVTNGEVQLYFALNGLPGVPAGFNLTSSTLAPAVPEPKSLALVLAAFVLMTVQRITSLRKRTNRS